jgi:hypothetical protein
MNRTRSPGGRFGDEAAEKSLRSGTDVVTAFRVPLDTEYEVSGTFRGLATLYGLDHSILRAAGGDAEAVAGDADGLMMAGVDGQAKKTVLLGSFFGGDDSAEKRIRCNGSGMGDGNATASRMVNRQDIEVLNQGTPAPDVEELEAETDGKDWLVEIMSILNKELVHVFASIVRRRALGDGLLTVLVRVDVRWAAGKENGLAGVDQVSGLGGAGFQRDLDRLAAAALYGCGIHGPGALVVNEVSAGWDRNSDAGFHDFFDDTADGQGMTDGSGFKSLRDRTMFHVERLASIRAYSR